MSSNLIFKETADDFLQVSKQFNLGSLITEQANPLTQDLSSCCEAEEDLKTKSLQMLKSVDLAAFASIIPSKYTETGGYRETTEIPSLESLKGMYPIATTETFSKLIVKVQQMSKQIHDTLVSGNNVFFAGCGATGRLALSLEVFAHLGLVAENHADQILGIHSGGDSALLRSIPEFEDKVEYGVRQLYDTGFREGDLVIAITEGGETPFVIAICEEAAKVCSKVSPWFLYCNPDDLLSGLVERSKRVIENPKIQKLNLFVGPMSITGSTRMQATSIQQLIAGLALAHHEDPSLIEHDLIDFSTFMRNVEYSQLGDATYADKLNW